MTALTDDRFSSLSLAQFPGSSDAVGLFRRRHPRCQGPEASHVDLTVPQLALAIRQRAELQEAAIESKDVGGSFGERAHGHHAACREIHDGARCGLTDAESEYSLSHVLHVR